MPTWTHRAWEALVGHFAAQRILHHQLHNLKEVAAEVVKSKQELDSVLADNHNSDEFRKFAEAARKSRFRGDAETA